ncbi:MAG: hypothetical protein CMI07_06215, partial [Oceanospirillaceae bacterium]|nr:hypothetical protein [Oceanospirillaceae bacterium]
NLLIGGPSFFDAGLMLCNLIMAQGGRVHLISYTEAGWFLSEVVLCGEVVGKKLPSYMAEAFAVT